MTCLVSLFICLLVEAVTTEKRSSHIPEALTHDFGHLRLRYFHCPQLFLYLTLRQLALQLVIKYREELKAVARGLSENFFDLNKKGVPKSGSEGREGDGRGVNITAGSLNFDDESCKMETWRRRKGEEMQKPVQHFCELL